MEMATKIETQEDRLLKHATIKGLRSGIVDDTIMISAMLRNGVTFDAQLPAKIARIWGRATRAYEQMRALESLDGVEWLRNNQDVEEPYCELCEKGEDHVEDD